MLSLRKINETAIELREAEMVSFSCRTDWATVRYRPAPVWGRPFFCAVEHQPAVQARDISFRLLRQNQTNFLHAGALGGVQYRHHGMLRHVVIVFEQQLRLAGRVHEFS